MSARGKLKGLEQGQKVNLIIADLPGMDARIEDLGDTHAIVGLFKEPDLPLKDIGPIEAVVEAPGPRGLARLVGTLRQHNDETDAARLDFDQGPEVIQRRQHVRIDTTTDVTVTRADGATSKAMTLNLSGAGLLLNGPADMQIDETIKVDIEVGEDAIPIHARGRVVRVTDKGHKGIRIEMIEEGDRERLIHFVFERQRTVARARA